MCIRDRLRKPPLDNLAGESTNHFRFRLGPGKISISLSARVKHPGEELVSKLAHLSVVEDDTTDQVLSLIHISTGPSSKSIQSIA